MLPSMTAPVTQAAVLDRIRAYATARKWTPGRLAVAAGLSRGTLSDLHDADWQPSTRIVMAIEAVIPEGWKPGDPVPTQAEEAAA